RSPRAHRQRVPRARTVPPAAERSAVRGAPHAARNAQARDPREQTAQRCRPLGREKPARAQKADPGGIVTLMRRIVVLPLILALVATPAPAAAWGFEAHKFIMARAIALLPTEIRPFFTKYETSIVEHSIDPDLWRTVGWLDESTRHFVDMDAYGPYPFKEFPRRYDE